MVDLAYGVQQLRPPQRLLFTWQYRIWWCTVLMEHGYSAISADCDASRGLVQHETLPERAAAQQRFTSTRRQWLPWYAVGVCAGCKATVNKAQPALTSFSQNLLRVSDGYKPLQQQFSIIFYYTKGYFHGIS